MGEAILRKSIYLILGWISFGLGLVGAFLPLLPTTPLMLLASFFWAKSSPRFHLWLVTHPKFGPMLRAWEERGAISRANKLVCSLMVAGSFVIVCLIQTVPWPVKVIIGLVKLGVLFFVWTRPE